MCSGWWVVFSFFCQLPAAAVPLPGAPLAFPDPEPHEDALQDAPEGEGRPGDDEAPVVDAPAPALPMAAAVGPIVAGSDVLALASQPIPVRDTPFTILYDFFSHSSGIQRAYIQCQKHKACFRYSQVNRFGSRAELHAYLTAWALEGPNHPRATHVSPLFQPPPDAIAAQMWRFQ